MKPRPIGILSGGGGPIGSTFILREIISACQKQYHCCRSYDFPCINFYSFPYSEKLAHDSSGAIAVQELGFCIQQLKLLGMEIVVIPCFTMGSYLSHRSFGVELIEMGAIMKLYLEKNEIEKPLVLCSERTRKSGYCLKHFECHYLSDLLQQELNALIQEAFKGNKIDMRPFLDRLPDVPIVCAMTTLAAQLLTPVNDPRWIDPTGLLASHVVERSYETSLNADFSPLRATALTA
jgi:aspartate/glutamate racemase